jgi:hypothetical protein
MNGVVMPKAMRHQSLISQEGLIALVLTVAICFLWIAAAVEILPALR